jgi:hypothetical protein
MVSDFFDDARLRREDWIPVKLNTDRKLPPSFRTRLIDSHIILKATLDIPWRFDKSVEVPVISGYCVEVPEASEDHMFGDY